MLAFCASLLKQYWWILLPCLVLFGGQGHPKSGFRHALQIVSRIIALGAAIIVVLGVFGLIIPAG